MLPPPPGSCGRCGVKHDEHAPHNPESVFYQVRFQLQYSRYPTWDDAVAHLDEEWRARWRRALTEAGGHWTETARPIAERYVIQ